MNLKEKLKEIIIQNQERIKGVYVVDREYNTEKEGNYVVIGPRRAGKTFFLYQTIKNRYKEGDFHKFLYINFEDERIMELNHTKLDLILKSYNELYNETPDLYFDEIQNIDHWEKFARRLSDQGYKIMITGSNSKMLSKEIATTLGGRFIVQKIFPLSFKEYLKFNNIVLKQNFEYSDQLNTVKRSFEEYFQYGGFPELIKFNNKRDYLSNLFQKVFYGDILSRHKVKNEQAMKLLIKKISESVNNETSISRIKNLIKSTGIPIGTATLIEYMNYLEESFLTFSVENFNNKFVERETKKKYYFVDNGLLMLYLFDKDTKLLENSVYIELSRHNDEIYFLKKNHEIDFYTPNEKGLYQVSYDISEPETRKREVKSLSKKMSELKIQSATIITKDSEEKIHIENLKINVVPIWKWLLK
ncbi:MAG: ATP-binding protein [Flavobacteriales bacterium]